MNRSGRRGRRDFMRLLAGLAVLAGPLGRAAPAPAREVIKRPVPSSGESLPVIGMGSWITFNVAGDTRARGALRGVLQAFFDNGGAVIDSSPMYASSEEVIGELLGEVSRRQVVFAATKIWTPGRWLGMQQVRHSQGLWGIDRFDLIQIHNMLDWQTHIETLKAWKAEGRVRYIGITTSHGQRHEAMERAMAREPFDFVQFTYSIERREAERRLLPLAKERGMAVIANRPFDGGDLFDRVRGKPLPPWAAEFDCRNWAQFFLKFIVSHPAVTCAIPATAKVDHMMENMGAGFGRLPDGALRKRMADHFTAL